MHILLAEAVQGLLKFQKLEGNITKQQNLPTICENIINGKYTFAISYFTAIPFS
jgi:hypothetical protein